VAGVGWCWTGRGRVAGTFSGHVGLSLNKEALGRIRASTDRPVDRFLVLSGTPESAHLCRVNGTERSGTPMASNTAFAMAPGTKAAENRRRS